MDVIKRQTGAATLAAMITFLLAGCDGLLGSDQAAFANEARVIVDGENPVPLLLVTSTNYIAQRNSETGELIPTLIVADTQGLPVLPHDSVYVIRGADRFLVTIANPDTALATVHLRVELDGREVFNQRATMRDASLTYMSFYSR